MRRVILSLLGFLLFIGTIGIADAGQAEVKNDTISAKCQKCNEGPCLESCFPTCLRLTGWATTGNINECGKCDGRVITVRDEIASDGDTVKVCKGKMKK